MHEFDKVQTKEFRYDVNEKAKTSQTNLPQQQLVMWCVEGIFVLIGTETNKMQNKTCVCALTFGEKHNSLVENQSTLKLSRPANKFYDIFLIGPSKLNFVSSVWFVFF